MCLPQAYLIPSSLREAAFQDLSVGTASLVLLAGNYLAASKGKANVLSYSNSNLRCGHVHVHVHVCTDVHSLFIF